MTLTKVERVLRAVVAISSAFTPGCSQASMGRMVYDCASVDDNDEVRDEFVTVLEKCLPHRTLGSCNSSPDGWPGTCNIYLGEPSLGSYLDEAMNVVGAIDSRVDYLDLDRLSSTRASRLAIKGSSTYAGQGHVATSAFSQQVHQG